jgi:hypothetical protein
VRANRKDVDRYAGVTDPVELLRLMHTPPKPDPLVNLLPPPKTFEELYFALTPEQARRLMTVASELLPDDEYQADEIAKCLAAFTDFKLDPMLGAWLDHDRPYPALIFRSAGAGVRDRLLRLLRNDLPTLRADHVLSALAWIGDEAVIQYLQTADVARPAWAAKLYVKPTDYARVAGWEVVAGERRELTSQTCLALHVAKEGEAQTDQVCVMRYREDQCPWCGCKLINLLEILASRPPLDPLHRLGGRIEVATCPVCTCFGTVHGELDADGRGRWAPKNVRPDILPKNAESWGVSPWSKVTVRLSERRPTHGADWCLPTTLSQIGGFPAWCSPRRTRPASSAEEP